MIKRLRFANNLNLCVESFQLIRARFFLVVLLCGRILCRTAAQMHDWSVKDRTIWIQHEKDNNSNFKARKMLITEIIIVIRRSILSQSLLLYVKLGFNATKQLIQINRRRRSLQRIINFTVFPLSLCLIVNLLRCSTEGGRGWSGHGDQIGRGRELKSNSALI